MKILVTGANGYIGRALIPALSNHEVIPLTRPTFDLLDRKSLDAIPDDIDVAYYLVHSMKEKDFPEKEAKCAENFVDRILETKAKQVVYLSGLFHGEPQSAHLASRKHVEEILSRAPLTVLRAGIIIGSGSASYEIIRDLVDKLPLMVAPKWVKSRCQPIAIEDVIYYLTHIIGHLGTFEIGGPDILTYRDMLLTYAKVHHLKRLILDVPVLTPRLSSYWLLLVTSTNFSLARALVDSLKHDATVEDHTIDAILPHKCLSYEESLFKTHQSGILSL